MFASRILGIVAIVLSLFATLPAAITQAAETTSEVKVTSKSLDIIQREYERETGRHKTIGRSSGYLNLKCIKAEEIFSPPQRVLDQIGPGTVLVWQAWVRNDSSRAAMLDLQTSWTTRGSRFDVSEAKIFINGLQIPDYQIDIQPGQELILGYELHAARKPYSVKDIPPGKDYLEFWPLLFIEPRDTSGSACTLAAASTSTLMPTPTIAPAPIPVASLVFSLKGDTPLAIMPGAQTTLMRFIATASSKDALLENDIYFRFFLDAGGAEASAGNFTLWDGNTMMGRGENLDPQTVKFSQLSVLIPANSKKVFDVRGDVSGPDGLEIKMSLLGPYQGLPLEQSLKILRP